MDNELLEKIVREVYETLAQIHLAFARNGDFIYRLRSSSEMLRNVAAWVDSYADKLESETTDD